MKTLETKRLILRKYTSDDFTPVHDYGSCAENTTYMLWGPNSEEQTWSYLESAIEEANKSPIDNYHYAVILKESGTLIGGCGIHISDL